MSYIKPTLIIILLFSLVYKPCEAKIDSTKFNFVSEKKLEAGEKLSYAVRYAFITLGEVTLKIIDKSKFKNKTLYSAEAFIDTYPDIPFVNIHQIYKSIFTSDLYSVYFKGITKNEDDTTDTQYNFDYDSSLVHIKKKDISSNKVLIDSTAKVDTFYQDGLSIFYFSRLKSGVTKSEEVPVFINEKKAETKINFYNEPTEISIDAVDYPIKCVKIDGKLNFVSVYGLTGNFEGWFTDDDAAIPILAKMQVIVGKVTVELINWERKGWKPPEFQE